MRIAIVEDEPAHAAVLRRPLTELDYECEVFEDGEALLRGLRRDSFDAFILDWQLPKMDGPEIVKWLRRRIDFRVPILFVTARADEEDIVHGLECGADDYMVKPVRRAELLARVKSMLRRAYPEQQAAASVFGRYAFDLHRRELTFDGVAIELQPREYDLALFLFRNLGRLLTHDQLFTEFWGVHDVDSRTLATHVSRLRRKLALHPENGYRIVPVYGLGYRLEAVTHEGDPQS